jgi:hypothetical protein
MKKYISCVALAGLVMFAACSKKNDPAPLTPEQLIVTPKGWVATAITINPAVQEPGFPPVTDFLAFLDPCVKDDITFFTLDLKYKVDEGASKCSPSDPQIFDQGTWSFNPAKTIITTLTSTGGDPVVYIIAELSASTFKGTYKIVEDFVGSGTATAYTLTFSYTAVK